MSSDQAALESVLPDTAMAHGTQPGEPLESLPSADAGHGLTGGPHPDPSHGDGIDGEGMSFDPSVPAVITAAPAPPTMNEPAATSESEARPESVAGQTMPTGQTAPTGQTTAPEAGPFSNTPMDAGDVLSSAPVAAAGDTSSTPDEAPARPRVQLNPTVRPDQARAVPYLPSSSGPEAPSEEVAPPPPPPSTAEFTRTEKVEIPSKGLALDPAEAAEIDAALAGLDAGAGQVAPRTDDVPGEQQPAKTVQEPQPGARLKGKVLSVHGDNLILDVGTRASGILQTRQFTEGQLPEIGAVLDVVVDRYDPAEGLLHLSPAKAGVSQPRGNWHEVAEGQVVDCTVTKSNKGGLEVSISNLRGFLPASQVDLGFVSDLEQFVGQKLRVRIVEVNPHKRNLVVSRRSYLESLRAEAREETWGKLSVGQVYSGTVKTLKDYGAFVDIGGVDGLLHVGEISWNRVNHPKDVLSEGQQVDVKILAIDRDKSKISLGMRQLQRSPWEDVANRYPPKAVVHGKVTKTTDFGAFIELEPGLEGLVHISELDHRRVMRVTDVVQVGQELDVQVISVDLDKKRIALSIKALVARPEPVKRAEENQPPAAPLYERKRKGPLKGGGTGSGGLMFGNS